MDPRCELMLLVRVHERKLLEAAAMLVRARRSLGGETHVDDVDAALDLTSRAERLVAEARAIRGELGDLVYA